MYICIFLFIYLIGYKEGAALLMKIWSGIINLILKNLKLSLVIFVGVIEILDTFVLLLCRWFLVWHSEDY